MLVLAALPLAASPQDEARRASSERLMQELMSGKAEVGGEFTLADSRGKPVSLSDFRGRWVLLYFGFTTCPDVCPTDLHEIAKAIRELGSAGSRVQPLFVTLDPERDLPVVIGEYAAAFHPRHVALTGSSAQISFVAGRYKVFFEKVPLGGGLGYTIDHSAFTYLIGPDGRYRGIIPRGTPSDRIRLVLLDAFEDAGKAALR